MHLLCPKLDGGLLDSLKKYKSSGYASYLVEPVDEADLEELWDEPE
ncbi:MAG: hypothetical protein QMC40_01920 [Vicingaceae bacterium]|jgi:hypothetical protein|tara:strand:+ start:500 stop:637 length:138 start_codon:yes stop_codon:yes gene_type:complete